MEAFVVYLGSHFYHLVAIPVFLLEGSWFIHTGSNHLCSEVGKKHANAIIRRLVAISLYPII